MSGLGIDAFSIKSNLRFSGAQRLLKTVCQRCAVPARSETLLFVKELGLHPARLSDLLERNPSGCEMCKGGILGRLPVLEYLTAGDIEKYSSAESLRKSVKCSIKTEVRRLFETGIIDFQEAREYL